MLGKAYHKPTPCQTPRDAGWAKSSYGKTTEIAAEMVRAFDPPKGLKVRVLLDAFSLGPTVTKACETRGFTWFSVASRNRTLTRTWGVSQKIGDLGPGLLKYAGRNVRMPRARYEAIVSAKLIQT